LTISSSDRASFSKPSWTRETVARSGVASNSAATFSFSFTQRPLARSWRNASFIFKNLPARMEWSSAREEEEEEEVPPPLRRTVSSCVTASEKLSAATALAMARTRRFRRWTEVARRWAGAALNQCGSCSSAVRT
jgi:hypothetical protein